MQVETTRGHAGSGWCSEPALATASRSWSAFRFALSQVCCDSNHQTIAHGITFRGELRLACESTTTLFFVSRSFLVPISFVVLWRYAPRRQTIGGSRRTTPRCNRNRSCYTCCYLEN